MNKLNNVKIASPELLRDLFSDLRDRHLLPVVGLLLVAIVAVPVLLGSGGDPAAQPAAATAPVTLPSGQAPAVLATDAGLRDYRKRLSGQGPRDPFEQQYTAPVLSGSELAEADRAELAPEVVAPPVPGAASPPQETPAAPAPAAGEGGGTADSSDGQRTPGDEHVSPPSGSTEIPVISHTVDVRTGQAGGVQARKGIERLTSLPNEDNPVVTYIGARVDGERALFLVSGDVLSIDHHAGCLLQREGPCQVLSLAPGQIATFEYGPNGVTYRLRLVRIEPALSLLG